MSQTIAIMPRFREDQAADFESMFEAEIMPLWRQFATEGKFSAASLTPVEGRALQPEEPLVWFGTTRFQVP